MLSGRPIPTTRRNPCPVCDNATGACRILPDETIFCKGLADFKKGEKANGYTCVKPCGTAHTATFRPDNSAEWTEERRREWEAQKVIRQQISQEQQQKSRERELDSSTRHELYSRLLGELELGQNTLTDLQRRGFSQEEIVNCGFKSVKRFQKLNERYPAKLPGIGKYGDSLVASPGYLCPVKNFDDEIVAFQVRLDHPQDGSRYKWLSTSKTATLHISDELPLAVFHPKAKPEGIALVEGVGAKPFLVASRLNQLVIGAAGGQWLSSPKQLQKYLERAYKVIGGDKLITIYPDAGDVLNKQVMNRWQQTVKLLEAGGWTAQFAWWGQFTKEDDDIDELTDYSNISYLSPTEFWAINQKQPDINPVGDWAWEQWVNSRKFTPDITIKKKDFCYESIPDTGVIVNVKSGLGTNKTGWLIEQIKKAKDRGAVIIGYRNNLLLQTVARAMGAGVAMYHLHEDDAYLLVADDYAVLVLCLDSIRHLDGRFTGRDIYLDESCSVLLHAVNGGTLGNDQPKILRMFKQALKDCNRVFMLDGMLSDIYVDQVAKLAGNKRVIKIQNAQKISAHDITFIDGIDAEGEIKKRDKSPLVGFMLDADVKPWIFCDSKELTKVLYKLLTASNKKGYVLNSETASEEWAKEFLADPNVFFGKNEPDFMILSPSGDSGISCTINGHFTHKISFFAGVLATNSQHQAMFRLRDNSVPHYVFCPRQSTIVNRSTPKNYSINKFRETQEAWLKQSAYLAALSADNQESAIEAISKAWQRDDDEWVSFSDRLAVLDNYEMNNLRKCLIHSLKEAGHNIEISQWEIDITAKNAEKQAKEEVKRQHSQEIDDAVPFDSIEEANQKAKASPNKAVQRRIEKTRLLDRLPGINLSEVWGAAFIYECLVNNRHFISQQERYWLLRNYEVAQKRHESIWNHAALSEDFFSRRLSRRGNEVIWALRELDILNLIDAGKEFHKDSPEVVDLVKKLRDRRDIQLALRLEKLEPETQEGAERIRILRSLISLVGFTTNFTARKRLQTEKGLLQVRHYSIVPAATASCATPPLNYKSEPGCGTPIQPSHTNASSGFDMAAAREAILAAVERRFTKWMGSDKAKISWEVEENLTSQSASSACATPPLNYKSEPGCGTPIQPSHTNASSDFQDELDEWQQAAAIDGVVGMIREVLEANNSEMWAEVVEIVPNTSLDAAKAKLEPSELASLAQIESAVTIQSESIEDIAVLLKDVAAMLKDGVDGGLDALIYLRESTEKVLLRQASRLVNVAERAVLRHWVGHLNVA